MDIHSQSVPVRVYLVEDSRVVRQRLVAMLGRIPGVEVVGEAEDAAEAIDEISVHRPDAIVLDLQLRSSSGLDVSRAIGARLPDTRIIVLTNHATPEHRDRCLAAGAQFFLDKTNEFGHLRTILEQMRTDRPQGALPC